MEPPEPAEPAVKRSLLAHVRAGAMAAGGCLISLGASFLLGVANARAAVQIAVWALGSLLSLGAASRFGHARSPRGVGEGIARGLAALFTGAPIVVAVIVAIVRLQPQGVGYAIRIAVPWMMGAVLIAVARRTLPVPSPPEPPLILDEIPAGILPPAPPHDHAAAYALTKAGPAVSAEETERDTPAVEVRVLWGRDVLRVDHLSPPRSYFIGDAACDFVIDGEPLGAARFPLIAVEGGRVVVNVPRGATGMIQTEAKHTTLERAIADGLAAPRSELPSATWITLDPGMKVTLSLPSSAAPAAYRDAPGAEEAGLARVVVEIALVRAGRVVGRELSLRGGARLFASMAIACALVGLVPVIDLFMMPLDGGSGAEQDRLRFIQHQLQVIEERELEREEADPQKPKTARPYFGRARFSDSWTFDDMITELGYRPSSELDVFWPTNACPSFHDAPYSSPDAELMRSDVCAYPADVTPFGLRALGLPMAPDPFGRDPDDAWVVQYANARRHAALLLPTLRDDAWSYHHPYAPPRMRSWPERLPQAHVKIEPLFDASGVVPEAAVSAIRRRTSDLRACYELGLAMSPNAEGTVMMYIVFGADGTVQTRAWWESSTAGGSLTPHCMARAIENLRFPPQSKFGRGRVRVRLHTSRP